MVFMGAVGAWQLQEVGAVAQALDAKAAAQVQAAVRSGQLVVLSFSGLVFAVAFALCYPLTVHIVKPVRVAARIAKRVAAGDLTVRVRTGGTDEAAQLMRALSEMTINLRTLLGEVSGGAHAVADTSSQIVQGNADLSQRTEEQATTLEQTASSLEELTSTVAQNAENARQASELAVDAAQVARQGGEAVGRVVSTMTGIAESSRRIGDIIGVIDGIAFQTNILALNAAVEAARAGEHGRGFAVVAAEVRNLAQRSATAAREIKGLVGESVDKVDAGTRLVDAAGRTMAEIVGSVGKVSERIAEIAAASREQSSGIEQVNTAVTHMDRVVQQNAALVEQASAATESMRVQAGALLQMVARFQVGDAPQAVAPIRYQPAAAQRPAPVSLRHAAAPRLAAQPRWTES
ncbi:HAMP domain-containing protein [Ramlibacter terrae]|uniref:HAMP domain-containing protein n=1 Tax=Ramlibacter terrae TaxID=2732511 RepID=A0ABX6P909_9BURK|nr:HAMP domain-containing protein [Ramlibacter terrae]